MDSDEPMERREPTSIEIDSVSTMDEIELDIHGDLDDEVFENNPDFADDEDDEDREDEEDEDL